MQIFMLVAVLLAACCSRPQGAARTLRPRTVWWRIACWTGKAGPGCPPRSAGGQAGSAKEMGGWGGERPLREQGRRPPARRGADPEFHSFEEVSPARAGLSLTSRDRHAVRPSVWRAPRPTHPKLHPGPTPSPPVWIALAPLFVKNLSYQIASAGSVLHQFVKQFLKSLAELAGVAAREELYSSIISMFYFSLARNIGQPRGVIRGVGLAQGGRF